jgi:hypothetical protein
LSSTEAEYYATSEIAKEVIFAKNLLEEMGIQLQFPINIKCDNVGAIYLANNHCNSQRTNHIDTRQHFVREWVEDEILKIIFTPTLNNTADIFTKNTSEEDFHTHAPKLVGPMPNKAEMCNFTSARYDDWVLENEHQYWIVVLKRKNKMKKSNIQSKPPCFKTKNKPLPQKEQRRKQQAKEVYEPIHIPDVPGRTKLDLSADYLEAMKIIPKVKNYTSKNFKVCQMRTKRVFPVIEGKLEFKNDNTNPNDDNCDFSVSIDDPNFGFVFLESFNEYLTQEKLKKENFAEFLNVKIAKAHATKNYSELIDNKEEWMYLKYKQLFPESYPLSFAQYNKSRASFIHFEMV